MDDIELQDKTKNFLPVLINNNSINLNNITNSNNNNCLTPNTLDQLSEINFISKNKKSIYGILNIF